MMFLRLKKDNRGAAAVEMALALPILFLFIYGIFQVGAMFAANAIMQGALGEGAREATIWPARTNAQIKTKIEAKVFSVYAGNFAVADPVTTTVAASAAVAARAASGTTPAVAASAAVAAVKKTRLTITYSVTPDMLFFTLRPLVITRTKTAYMPIEAST